MAVKIVKKTSRSSDLFIFKNRVHLQHLKGMQTVRERSTICQKNVYERGSFSVKMVYKRARGWASGRSLSVENFIE